jgi:hypothetical protein
MTVKESFNVAGLPTTFGNPLWKDNIAADNAFLNQEAAMNAFYEHDTDSIRFGYRCFDHRDGWTKLAEWTTEDAV